MAFCNKKEQLYIETDVWYVGLRESLLQVKCRVLFPENETYNNAAFSANSICKQKPDQCWKYSNIK